MGAKHIPQLTLKVCVKDVLHREKYSINFLYFNMLDIVKVAEATPFKY